MKNYTRWHDKNLISLQMQIGELGIDRYYMDSLIFILLISITTRSLLGSSLLVPSLDSSRFEDECLKAALKKVLDGESQDIIELVLIFIKKTVTKHSSKESFTFKDTTRVLFIKCQQIPSVITDSAEGVLNPPQLPLAPKSILSHKLQLCIQTLLLVWTTWLLERFPIY
ncbi:hypothetical protein Lal_00006326 [Lupinus albus]|nr:hypothetical protein Lal_00006326 [Lupinus albus]